MQTQEMKDDIEEICKGLNVKVTWLELTDPGVNCANAKAKIIKVRKISNTGDYAAALHEIGHTQCDADHKPEPGEGSVLQECRGWQWAIDQRGCNFDSAAWRRIGNGLGEYLNKAGIDEGNAPSQCKEIMKRVEEHSVYTAPTPASLVPAKKRP
jgi:hypothetical protein